MIQSFKVLKSVSWLGRQYSRGQIIRVDSRESADRLLALAPGRVAPRPFVGWPPERIVTQSTPTPVVPPAPQEDPVEEPRSSRRCTIPQPEGSE